MAAEISAVNPRHPSPAILLADLSKTGSRDKDALSARDVERTPSNRSVNNSATGLDSAQVDALPQKVEYQYLACLFWVMIVCGWNDASSGPLIPRMQEYYGIGYTIVSLIFVCICIGFIGAALANVWLEDRFGTGKVMLLGTTGQMIAYILMCSGGPFPLFCVGFVIAGFGSGLVISLAAAIVSKLPTHQNLKMCIFQACYGLGALGAPLVATQFSRLRTEWRFHYCVSLGLATTSLALIGFVLRGKREEDLLPHTKGDSAEHEGSDGQRNSGRKMKIIMKTRVVHMLAVWAFIYVGLEVTIGGWIVTFLQEVRGGGNDSGYVSTGFWAGLTVGRLCFIWINEKLGERRVVFGYAVIAIGLEFVIWFVPHLIGNAVAVSFLGLCLGPMFPIMLSQASQAIPRAVFAGSICWIESLGQVGSAILPFATGALSSRYGIQALQPMVVAMLGGVMFCWAGVLVLARPRKVD